MEFLFSISYLQPAFEVFTQLQTYFVFQSFIHCFCGLEVARLSLRVLVSLYMFAVTTPYLLYMYLLFYSLASDFLKLCLRFRQARLVSNYDYLMYLNLAAGRSFCDLTQWPIMPWVLCDYKSPKLDLTDPTVYRDLSKVHILTLSLVFLDRFLLSCSRISCVY